MNSPITSQKSLPLKFGFLLVGILAYVGAFSVEAQQLTTLAVGYPARSLGSIQLYIAQERGFFREEGLQVNLKQIRGDVAKAGMLTRDLFAYNSVAASARAFQAGAPLKRLPCRSKITMEAQ
jgi:ABC-type nitrate/sulfonate/bicarbonate transport system substrate-binding protein